MAPDTVLTTQTLQAVRVQTDQATRDATEAGNRDTRPLAVAWRECQPATNSKNRRSLCQQASGRIRDRCGPRKTKFAAVLIQTASRLCAQNAAQPLRPLQKRSLRAAR